MLHERLVRVFRLGIASFGVELALGCDLDSHWSERVACTGDGTSRVSMAADSTCRLLNSQNNHTKDDTLEHD